MIKSKDEGDRFEFTRYKITYECKKSDIIDETKAGGATKIEGFAIYKSKEALGYYFKCMERYFIN